MSMLKKVVIDHEVGKSIPTRSSGNLTSPLHEKGNRPSRLRKIKKRNRRNGEMTTRCCNIFTITLKHTKKLMDEIDLKAFFIENGKSIFFWG